MLPEALFPRSVPENAELADLIASCLHKDFEKRVTAEALLLPLLRPSLLLLPLRLRQLR